MDQDQPSISELREQLRRRAQESDSFNRTWEEEALPQLRTSMEHNSVQHYYVTIQFDYSINQRVVEIMTPKELPKDMERRVGNDIERLFLRTDKHHFIRVEFHVGTLNRTADVEDSSGLAANPCHHSSLLMGDSVDCKGGKSAATLGPAIKFGRDPGYLVSGHLFDGFLRSRHFQQGKKLRKLHLVHPGNLDCADGIIPRQIGRLRAISGPIYKTQRPSRSLKEHCPRVPKEDAVVVTDWAVCVPEHGNLELSNRLRYAPRGREFQDCSGPIPGVYLENPKLRLVRSSGRTSGIRWAVVCETPAFVKQGSTPTREWYLENRTGTGMNTAQWISAGPGIPGDSGAAVIDDEGKWLIGQIWGRNVYSGDPSTARVTYFTHIADVFDDIQERCPDIAYPELLDQETDPAATPHSAHHRTDNARNASDAHSDSDGETDDDGTTLSPTPNNGHARSVVTKSPSRDSATLSCNGSIEATKKYGLDVSVGGKGINGLNTLEGSLPII